MGDENGKFLKLEDLERGLARILRSKMVYVKYLQHTGIQPSKTTQFYLLQLKEKANMKPGTV